MRLLFFNSNRRAGYWRAAPVQVITQPVYWIRSVYWWRGEAARSRRSRDHRLPPAGEGASPEAPPEGPAGGAPPEANFYAIWLH